MMHTPVEQFPLENLMGKLTTDEDAFFAQSVDGSTPSVSSDCDSASHNEDEELNASPHPDMVEATALENAIVVAATDQQEGKMLNASAFDAHVLPESEDYVTDATGNAKHPIAALSSQSMDATGEADMDPEMHESVVESPELTWDSMGVELNDNVPTAPPSTEISPPTQPNSDEDTPIRDFGPIVEESTSPVFSPRDAMLNDEPIGSMDSHVVEEVDQVHHEAPTVKEFDVNLVLDETVAESPEEAPPEAVKKVLSMSGEQTNKTSVNPTAIDVSVVQASVTSQLGMAVPSDVANSTDMEKEEKLTHEAPDADHVPSLAETTAPAADGDSIANVQPSEGPVTDFISDEEEAVENPVADHAFVPDDTDESASISDDGRSGALVVEEAPTELLADDPADDSAILVEMAHASVPIDDVVPGVDHSETDALAHPPLCSFVSKDKVPLEYKGESPPPDTILTVEEPVPETVIALDIHHSEIVAVVAPAADVITFAEDAHVKMGLEDRATDEVCAVVRRVGDAAVDDLEADVVLDSSEVIPSSVEEKASPAQVQNSDEAFPVTEENAASDPVLDSAEISPSSVEENASPAPKVDNEHVDMTADVEISSPFIASQSAVAIEKSSTDFPSFVDETTVSVPKADIAVDVELPFKAGTEDSAAFIVPVAEDTPAVEVEDGPAEHSPEENNVLSPWDMTDQSLAENVEVADVEEPEIHSKMILQHPVLDGITDANAELVVTGATTTEVLQDSENPATLTIVMPAVAECHLDQTEQTPNPEVSIRDVHEFDVSEIESDVEATIRALLALSPIHEQTKDSRLPSDKKLQEVLELDLEAVKFDPLLMEEKSIEEPQIHTPAARSDDDDDHHHHPGRALVVDVEMPSNADKVHFDAEPLKPKSERDVEYVVAIDDEEFTTPFFVCPDTPYGENEIHDRYAFSDDVVDVKDDDDLPRVDNNDENHDKYALSDAESIDCTDVITITTVDFSRTERKGVVRFVDVEPETPSEFLSQEDVLSEQLPFNEDLADDNEGRFNQGGGCVDCVIL